jgi:hypothetical protein
LKNIQREFRKFGGEKLKGKLNSLGSRSKSGNGTKRIPVKKLDESLIKKEFAGPLFKVVKIGEPGNRKRGRPPL